MHDSPNAVPAYAAKMDERASRVQQVQGTRLAPPPQPTGPLLGRVQGSLGGLTERLYHIVSRVRSAADTTFGSVPETTAAGLGEKSHTIADGIVGQLDELHRVIAQLDDEASRLINQLL